MESDLVTLPSISLFTNQEAGLSLCPELLLGSHYIGITDLITDYIIKYSPQGLADSPKPLVMVGFSGGHPLPEPSHLLA